MKKGETVKKIISVILSVAVIASCFAVTFSVYGKTTPLVLNVKTAGTIDGAGDLARFSFVPEASGTYSFLSYETPATEAYLIVREEDPVTHDRKEVTLAYANFDENYTANDHKSTQFCLTYHLEAGQTYYFEAGWLKYEDRTSGTITVMLRCDEYDLKLEKIEVECFADLESLTDGNWTTDSDGNLFFMYNISKIITSTRVTIYYPDGTVSSEFGQLTIDGYTIFFNHNQYYEHWYPQGDGMYTSNAMTISVLGVSQTVDIKISSVPKYAVRGTVTDMLGNPVEGAKVRYQNSTLATTDSNGEFYFAHAAGQLSLNVTADNAVTRKFIMVVEAVSDSNDMRSEPISIYTCNYCNDSIINAKDYAIMIKTLEGDELEKNKILFQDYINFTTDDYPSLTVGA